MLLKQLSTPEIGLSIGLLKIQGQPLGVMPAAVLVQPETCLPSTPINQNATCPEPLIQATGRNVEPGMDALGPLLSELRSNLCWCLAKALWAWCKGKGKCYVLGALVAVVGLIVLFGGIRYLRERGVITPKSNLTSRNCEVTSRIRRDS